MKKVLISFAAVALIAGVLLALRHQLNSLDKSDVNTTAALNLPDEPEAQNLPGTIPTDPETEALLDKALAPTQKRGEYLLTSGLVRTIEDAEHAFVSLDCLHSRLDTKLSVYMPALLTFIDRSVAPRDKAQGKYFLLQSSLLTRDIATVMDLLNELASDGQFDLLKPIQQGTVVVTQLGLKYLALGGAGRNGFKPESVPLLAPCLDQALLMEQTDQLGFKVRDVAAAFGNLIADKASLLDEAVITATFQYGILRSDLHPGDQYSSLNEYRDIILYEPRRRPGKDLSTLYDSENFQKELASLRQTDPEKALLIEYYTLHSLHGIEPHKLVYTRAMELVEELPENHPCRPWFASLALSQGKESADSRYLNLERYVRSFDASQLGSRW